jgi:hypothetical protein
MSKEDNILDQLKKTERPSVPNGYFDNFASSLKLDEEETSFLEALPKSEKPKLSTDFFDNFSTDIITKLDKPKKGKVISLKQIVMTIASVAAIVSVVFLMTKTSNTDAIAEVEYNTEEYLAFIDLDESEYIDFIIENNISFDEELDEIDETVLYELESELDDYFYEL